MSLLPSFIEQRLEPVADVTRWRLHLEWRDDHLQVDAGDFLLVPEFRQQAAWSWNDGPSSDYSGRATIHLAASSVAAAWLAERTRRDPDFAPLATLGLLVGEYPVEERRVLRGAATRWWIEPARLRLEIESAWPWDTQRLLCRDLALLPSGVAGGLRGPRWLPQVFGEVAAVPMARLAAGDSVALRVRLEHTHTDAVLDQQPEGWPASGSVQVNDEVMTYAAIADDPPRLVGLVRPSARDHAAGARAMWLPPGGAMWIAADHAAEVLALATAAQPTLALAGASSGPHELDGRTTTRVVFGQWPVGQRDGATVQVVEDPSVAARWQLDVSTSAQDPALAWGEPDAANGTVFKRAATSWRATSMRPADATMGRFARLERLRLRGDVAFAATWSAAESFTVRVRRGPAVVEKQLTKPPGVGVALEASVALGVGALGAASAAVPPQMFRFSRVEPTGDSIWQDAEQAIDGGLATFATLDRLDGLVGTLRLVVDPVPVFAAPVVDRLVLLVHARLNSGVADLVATLTTSAFIVSATAALSVSFSWVSLELVLPPGSHTLADVLEAASVLAIDASAECSLQVADVLLVVGYRDQALALPANTAMLALNATQASPFAPFEVDATALLLGDHDWAALHGDIAVEMALVSLVNGERVEVRHLRWAMDVRPAASVRLETELVATVRGRLTQGDGRCDPVAVVEALWGGGDLLDQPSGELDAAATARARSIVGLAGRRFRAAFAGRATADAVMRRALAEGGLMLAPPEVGWALRAVDALVAHPTVGSLTAAQMVALAPARPIEAAPLRARRVVVQRGDGRVVADVGRGAGRGEQRVVATWLDAGGTSLVACGIDHAGHRRERLRWRARPSWWWTPPGSRLALDLPGSVLVDADVWVDSIEFGDGETWQEGWLASPWSVVRIDGLEVRREVAGPRLLFVAGGRVWAMLDAAGDLRITGDVLTDLGVGPYAPGPAMALDGGDGLTFGTLGMGAMAVAPDGGLRVGGSLATGVALAGDGPPTGWSLSPAGLTLGTPELGVVAFLEAATGNLSLRGQVRGLVP